MLYRKPYSGNILVNLIKYSKQNTIVLEENYLIVITQRILPNYDGRRFCKTVTKHKHR